MAINKKLIHFKTFENFNSQKLSANEENTKYTLGVDREVQTGSPDILYQSIVWIKDAQKQWTHGQLYDGKDFSVLVEITYEELKTLRDNSQLIPGQQYRIIDYVTTTIQENTQSAGHQFDVIVTADDESTLNEIARAIQHDGDTYFTDSDLNAWQIWYCLNNDTNRFTWADATNGKGVIYRMIDEFGNDIPYDFKNILYIDKEGFKYNQWGSDYQFIRNSALDKVIDSTQYYGYSSETTPSAWSDGKCWVTDIEITPNTQLYKEDGSAISYGGTISNIITKDIEYYTFRKANEDDSLYGIAKDNVVKPIQQNGMQLLNKNIFGVGCYSNKIGYNSFNNTFGNNCYENTLLGGCIEEYGSIRYCANNSFGNGCCLNVFGCVAFSNTFGENCKNNSFGNACNNNTFGDSCVNNSFGNSCHANSFGNACNYNSFGNACNSNSFRVNADTSSSLRNYVEYNHFDDGCSYNVIWTQSPNGVYLRNININRGVLGAASSYNYINIDLVYKDYEIKVAKNSKGEIKIYCEADLIA